VYVGNDDKLNTTQQEKQQQTQQLTQTQCYARQPLLQTHARHGQMTDRRVIKLN